MSLRGVGKALYRTPHQLFGQKTTEDAIFKHWESDIKVALAGLEYLKIENQKWKKFWISAITNFIQVIDIFKDLHCKLEHYKGKSKKSNNDTDEQTTDKNEEFTSVTIHELEQAGKLANILLNKTTKLVDNASDSFVAKCNGMIDILKGVEKLITKRDHKKIDYDMTSNKVESTLKNIKNDKDKAKLETEQQKYNESEIIYKDLNEKIKLIIPGVFSNLSEFINKLTYKLYFSNLDILEFIQRNVEKFDKIHGIVSNSDIMSYEDIIADFNGMYSQAQSKLENLSLFKEFRSFRNKNLTEKTVDQVNNVAGTVVDTTVNFTSTMYTKAAKPSQKLAFSLTSFKIDNPVKPYDKHGMFTTALDPIDFIKDASIAMSLSKSDLKELSIDYSKHEFNDTTIEAVDNTEHDSISSDGKTAINDDQISYREEKVSITGTEWMKPLRNSTLNKVTTSSTTAANTVSGLSSTKLDNLEEVSAHDNISTTQKNRVSSLRLDSNTDTYKYVNVSMDSITKRMYLVITTPEITSAPVTTSKDRLNYQDFEVKDYIIARSSITANAFAAYSNV